jgi:alpha-tubulin suppressor-like RCC1 family protein
VVSAGGSVACALSADGRAFCWGDNYDGQLGTGTSASSTSNLLPVAGSLTFRSISVGEHHVCGLTAAGAAYCWGLNYYGALGNGTTANALAPVPVAGGLTFADVSAGAMHTCAVTAAGAAYCWGYNGNGQLGNGTTSDSPLTTPTPVTGGITFASVSAGEGFTCGIAVGGAMYCWGSNGYGQLGTGVFGGPSVTAPMPVTGSLLFRP